MIGKRAFLFAIGLMLLSSCTTYQVDAATYKWTDKNGQVNYTQSPPRHTAYSIMTPAPAYLSQVSAKAEPLPKITAEQQDIKIIYEHNCKEATGLLNSIEQAGHKQVAVLDSQGKQKVLTPEERAVYAEKAKQDMSKYCTNKSSVIQD